MIFKYFFRAFVLITINSPGVIVAQANVTDAKKDFKSLENNNEKKELEEKLVATAIKNNPLYSMAELENKIAGEKVKAAKRSWLEYIELTGNLNEANINLANSTGTPANYYFPRYNIGVRFNLGSIAERPANIKEAKYEVLLTQKNIELQALGLRKKVLQGYWLYEHNQKLLGIRDSDYKEALLNYKKLSGDFNNGNITMEELEECRQAYNIAFERKLVAENELYISKTGLEELLGVSLESILTTKEEF